MTAAAVPLSKPERLTDEHDVRGFETTEPDITRFLKDDALKHGALGLSVTYVVCRESTRQVVGFISLCASNQSAKPSSGKPGKRILPGELGASRFPVPAILIGQLGRHRDLARSGIGRGLALFAIREAVRVAERIGVACIVLDAMHDGLFDYYRSLQFERVPTYSRRMLLTIADARIALAAVGG